jgi:transcriptional regulator with XRE-family HTH domain
MSVADTSCVGMEFGKKLLKLIHERGDSQQAIADDLGCSQHLISTWCSGKSEPSFSRARFLAERFGVPLSYLADDDLDEPEPPEVTPHERSIILIFRSLEKIHGLTVQEAVDRLTGGYPVPSARKSRPGGSGAG